MQLSFMTFSCPEATLTEVLTAAIQYGYDAVEPRAEASYRHGVELETTKKERAQIKASFADTGVACGCIATSRTYSMADAEKRRESVELTKKYVDLAHDLGCPTIRVFGGGTPEGADFADVKKYVAEALRECAEHGQKAGVYVCMETHDGYCKSADLMDVINLANHPFAAVNWDIMHPFRVGDTIAEAFEAVKDHVRHCHVHDGVPGPDGGPNGWQLALMGEGQIPHDEAFKLLATIGYKGCLSGEWINFLPADECLPHEAEVMRRYRAEALAALK